MHSTLISITRTFRIHQSCILFSLIISLLFSCCSGYCSVSTHYGLNAANCTDRSLSRIPHTLRDDIKILLFDHNHLTHIGAQDFRPYPHILELRLTRNQISSIAPDAFLPLDHLQTLDLTGNALTSLPIESLHRRDNLRTLYLNDNPISSIPGHAFTSTPNLETLCLDGCAINFIHPHAFVNLTRLTELGLSNNQLPRIEPPQAPLSWVHSSLLVLRIQLNSWECDCKLRWLRQLLLENGRRMVTGEGPSCSQPSKLKGLSLLKLEEEELACVSRLQRVGPADVSLREGQNFTLECLAYGDPDPTVDWTKGSRPLPLTLGKVSLNHLWAVKLQERRTLASLTLTQVTVSDHQGQYSCVAVNPAGEVSVIYTVDVISATELDRYGELRSDWLSPELWNRLTAQQRAALILSSAVLLIALMSVLMTSCVLTQRRRWRNVYRVRDKVKDGVILCNGEGQSNYESVKQNKGGMTGSTEMKKMNGGKKGSGNNVTIVCGSQTNRPTSFRIINSDSTPTAVVSSMRTKTDRVKRGITESTVQAGGSDIQSQGVIKAREESAESRRGSQASNTRRDSIGNRTEGPGGSQKCATLNYRKDSINSSSDRTLQRRRRSSLSERAELKDVNQSCSSSLDGSVILSKARDIRIKNTCGFLPEYYNISNSVPKKLGKNLSENCQADSYIRQTSTLGRVRVQNTSADMRLDCARSSVRL